MTPTKTQRMEDLYPRCKKCKSTNVATERRPDGDSRCLNCGASGASKDFLLPPKAVEDATKTPDIVEYKYKEDNYVEPHFVGQKTPEQRRDEYARKYAEAHIDVEWAVIDGWDAGRADMLKNPPEEWVKFRNEVSRGLEILLGDADPDFFAKSVATLRAALKAFDESRKK